MKPALLVTTALLGAACTAGYDCPEKRPEPVRGGEFRTSPYGGSPGDGTDAGAREQYAAIEKHVSIALVANRVTVRFPDPAGGTRVETYRIVRR